MWFRHILRLLNPLKVNGIVQGMLVFRMLSPAYEQKPIMRRPDMQPEEKNHNFVEIQVRKDRSEIMDYKVTMLITAGAAMAAN